MKPCGTSRGSDNATIRAAESAFTFVNVDSGYNQAVWLMTNLVQDSPRGTRDMCKWYPVCPMKVFYERGVLDAYWIEQFCFGNHERCARYQMEESGKPHPDNMLPDGSIAQELDSQGG